MLNADTQAHVEPTIAPLTGQEYLESLRDGREVYIYGEKVRDVTAHPAFRNSARMIARLYDALHDPSLQDTLTCPTDTGSGSFTHPFFRTPRSAQDLLAGRDAIAAWSRLSYGWIGRSPDYKAAFVATLGANADFYAPFDQNARHWYKRVQERMFYLNHAIVHPPVDRHKNPDEVADVFVHVERETDAGLIVSGAKMVATGSALTHYNFVAHYGLPLRKKEFALIFILPTHAPGVKLISRASYEMTASVMSSPFDAPLSSRMDENDAILVFDRALVPWENVFVYGDIEKANHFFPASGFVPRFTLHGCTRLAVKLDFLAGLLLKAVEAAGSQLYRGVQAQVGEVLAWRNLFWGLSDSMAMNPLPWVGGAVMPNLDSANAYRVLATQAYPRVKEIIEQVCAGGLVYGTSHAIDFHSDRMRPYLDKYLRGSNGIDAVERIKTFKLLWDAIGSEFGGRHELYERNYAGNHEDIRIQTLLAAQATGQAEAFKGFAQKCMDEYDLDGWTSQDLINPGDVNYFMNRQ